MIEQIKAKLNNRPIRKINYQSQQLLQKKLHLLLERKN
jgi:hypothetical protein